MKSNRFWIIILSGVVIISAITAFLLSRTPASYARVYSDGELTATVNLADVPESYMFYATGTHGNNIISVEQGRIRVFAASCPDLICVRQGWVSNGLVPIVCLPNRLVITLDDGNNDKGVDAVVG